MMKLNQKINNFLVTNTLFFFVLIISVIFFNLNYTFSMAFFSTFLLAYLSKGLRKK